MTPKIHPVLVGAGQLIDRPEHLSEALSPLAMMHATAQACAVNAGLTPAQLKEIDTLVVIDTVGPALLKNPPAALARCIGAQSSTQYLTVTGGNTPQMLVNHFAREIACERASMVLLSGAEALDTLARSAKTSHALNWQESLGGGGEGLPALLTVDRSGSNETEKAHGMVAPIVTYPLFENALRRHYGRSLKDHQLAIGKLLAPYTDIASENPCAWFPTPRTAEEIATPTATNRYIGFPYTKYMNAIMQVNQSASVLLMSDLKAKSLGIDESRWIYLHGHCDVNDIWNVSERVNFHSSPALEAGISSVLDMAQISPPEIDHFDIYSCFPAVIEITRDLLGIPDADSRPLTVTGGLPYFGGAGNNYSMHAIATMMDHLRQTPGERGLVTANGWYLTKHSLGIYSTDRPDRPFSMSDSGELNRQIESLQHPKMNPTPSGRASIETYTVMFDRGGRPQQGLVLGMLDHGGRFVAHTQSDEALLDQMTQQDPIGQTGRVQSGESTNLFEFD